MLLSHIEFPLFLQRHLVYNHFPPSFVPLLPHEVGNLAILLYSHQSGLDLLGLCPIHHVGLLEFLNLLFRVSLLHAHKYFKDALLFEVFLEIVNSLVDFLFDVALHPVNPGCLFVLFFLPEFLVLSLRLPSYFQVFLVIFLPFLIPVLHECHISL